MEHRDIHITLIGPKTNAATGLIGGATISFGHLEAYFQMAQVPYDVINTQRYSGRYAKVKNIISVYRQVTTALPKTDVIFLNSSRGGTKYLAPFLFLLCRLFRKKFVFRPFGGNIKDYVAEYSALQKWIFEKTILKSDIFYLQTDALMRYYEGLASCVLQLPTSRYQPEKSLLRARSAYRGRFLYLGFINEYKGIDLLLSAQERLGADYIIDIWGPIKQDKYDGLQDRSQSYKGVLKKDEVVEKMAQYDVLVLPTYYEGEGYPGVIIEAYSLGMPVITTHWRSIPEIVNDGVTGILIKPRSLDSLVSAMKYFDEDNYHRFSAAARSYFLERFDAMTVGRDVHAQIIKLFK